MKSGAYWEGTTYYIRVASKQENLFNDKAWETHFYSNSGDIPNQFEFDHKIFTVPNLQMLFEKGMAARKNFIIKLFSADKEPYYVECEIRLDGASKPVSRNAEGTTYFSLLQLPIEAAFKVQSIDKVLNKIYRKIVGLYPFRNHAVCEINNYVEVSPSITSDKKFIAMLKNTAEFMKEKSTVELMKERKSIVDAQNSHPRKIYALENGSNLPLPRSMRNGMIVSAGTVTDLESKSVLVLQKERKLRII